MKSLIRASYGTPLMIISHRALNIEKPAEFANKIAEDTLKRKLDPNLDDKNSLKKIKDSTEPSTSEPVFKRKKAKGPNPLSCKKKRLNTQNGNKKRSNFNFNKKNIK
jgi:U3 small nucleolar RNA-associated protein 23